MHNISIPWDVNFHDDFVSEYEKLSEAVQDELQALVEVLEILEPQMKRPCVDTLKGSRHKKLKELRFEAADGVWRFAFAFDPKRRAIILCGGDKSGGCESRFYKQRIAIADKRFDTHCAALKEEG
jgi:hypothetical protein